MPRTVARAVARPGHRHGAGRGDHRRHRVAHRAAVARGTGRRQRPDGRADRADSGRRLRRPAAQRARHERLADQCPRHQHDVAGAPRVSRRPSSFSSTAALSISISSASSCGISCRSTHARSSRSRSVRGPGSAVWGANAMNGVVNVITKRPKEMQGSLTLGAGELGTVLGGITAAGANDKTGCKVSLGYYEQDAYPRPTGSVPGTESPTNPNGTPYPDYRQPGHRAAQGRPALRLRASTDTTWRFSGGYAGTDGLVHTGIGPFDINDTAEMTYFKADWNRKAAQVSFYSNMLEGDATNLLAVDTQFNPLLFEFQSDTYNLDFTNTSILGSSHILTYGANARTNDFELSIAPGGRPARRIRRLHPGRDSAGRQSPLAHRRSLRRHRSRSTRSSHLARRCSIRRHRTAPSAPLTTRRSVRHRWSTTTSRSSFST